MIKVLLKPISILLGTLFFHQALFSQESANKFVNQRLFPSKPDVASIGKFGDLPVNISTGQLDLSVPFYEITVNDFKLPVTLKYGYNGFRVDEVPGRMGLGWSFLCGGVISRQVRGIPDEVLDGYIYNNGYVVKNYVFPYINNGTQPPITFLSGVIDGNSDTEPDKFNISAGNLSGSFYFNDNRVPTFIPHKNYKIQCDASLNSFIVTDDKGVKYKFDKKELSQTTPDDGQITNSVSSWLLTEISFADNNELITFEYDSYSFSQESISESSTKYTSGGQCSGPCYTKYNGTINRSVSTTDIDGYHLKKIVFPEGGVEIINLSGVTNGTVGGVKLVNKQGQTTQEYNFEYDSYGLNGSGKLLRKIIKKTAGVTIPFYEFEYYPGLPLDALGNTNAITYSSLTFSQDFWGYYNGKNNTTLLPDFQTENRSPSFINSQKGALKKVIYPTRGSTELFYEPNYVGKNYLNSFQYFTPQTFNQTKTVFSRVLTTSGTDNDTDTLVIPEDQFVEVNYSLLTQTLNSTAEVYIERITIDGACGAGNSGSGENDFEGTMVYCLNLTKILDGEIAQNDPNSNNIASISNTWNVKIKKGTYRITTSMLNKGSASVTIKWNDFSTNPPQGTVEQYEVGGIRILKTIDNDATTGKDVIKFYKYLNEAGTKSSGILLEMPVYDTNLTGSTDCSGGSNPAAPVEGLCPFRLKLAQSRIPLAAFQGSHVLYNRVEVIEGLNSENGKTVYQFSGKENPLGGFPYSPWESKEWRKGMIETKKIFLGNSTQLKESYGASYTPQTPNTNPQLQGLKIGLKKQLNALNGASFKIELYYHQSDFIGIVADTTFIYPPSGTPLSTQTSYFYHPQYKYPDYTLIKNSKNQIRKEETKYPFHYSGTAVYDEMVNRNQLQIPIEQISSDVTGSSIELKRQKNNFQLWPAFNNWAWPTTVQTSLSGNPLVSEVTYNQYDNTGNVLQYTGKDGVPVSFVWGYTQQYPIAQTTNAVVTDIAYTSFEDEGFGNWGFGPWKIRYDASTVTGKKVYDLDGGMWCINLNPATVYKLSFWSKGSKPGVNVNYSGGSGTVLSSGDIVLKRTLGSWNYYEATFTNVVSVGIWRYGSEPQTFVDEVRIHPKDALMTTYTYEPLIGMTSQCDVNSRIQYYQYDALNRLQYIRDENKNLLKMYCYNYSGQTEECTGTAVGNDAMMQTFYRNDCGAGSLGGPYAYSVPANAYMAATKTAANQLAQFEINTNGQLYANTNGSCTAGTVYARIEYLNGYTGSNYTTEYGDVVIRFYSNASFTQPVSVTNLTVNFKLQYDRYDLNTGNNTTSTTTNYTITANGSQYVIGTSVLLYEIAGIYESLWTYYMLPGSGYISY